MANEKYTSQYTGEQIDHGFALLFEGEQARDAKFQESEALRNAAVQAALDAAETIRNLAERVAQLESGGGHPIEIKGDGVGDMDISDDDGYIIMRVENGHIRTKNFYSGNVYTKAEVDAIVQNILNQIQNG